VNVNVVFTHGQRNLQACINDKLVYVNNTPQKSFIELSLELGNEGSECKNLSGDRHPNWANEKTLVSQGFTEKNQGLGAMRALGLEPRTQGLKVLCKHRLYQ